MQITSDAHNAGPRANSSNSTASAPGNKKLDAAAQCLLRLTPAAYEALT
jgi:hypothetical protein